MSSINHLKYKQNISELEEEIEKRRITLSSLKSIKELLIVIYFPVQILLWSKSLEINYLSFFVIVITIVFLYLLHKQNKMICKLEIEITRYERKIKYIEDSYRESRHYED